MKSVLLLLGVGLALAQADGRAAEANEARAVVPQDGMPDVIQNNYVGAGEDSDSNASLEAFVNNAQAEQDSSLPLADLGFRPDCCQGPGPCDPPCAPKPKPITKTVTKFCTTCTTLTKSVSVIIPDPTTVSKVRYCTTTVVRSKTLTKCIDRTKTATEYFPKHTTVTKTVTTVWDPPKCSKPPCHRDPWGKAKRDTAHHSSCEDDSSDPSCEEEDPHQHHHHKHHGHKHHHHSHKHHHHGHKHHGHKHHHHGHKHHHHHKITETVTETATTTELVAPTAQPGEESPIKCGLCHTWHQVWPTETCESIQWKYNLSESELQKLNPWINCPTSFKEGQWLCVSGCQVPVRFSSATSSSLPSPTYVPCGHQEACVPCARPGVCPRGGRHAFCPENYACQAI